MGFAPSFFLRPLFTGRPLPAYLYLHGIVLTAWFSLLLTQSCLIAARRIHLHRRFGIAAAVTAVALVPLSAFVTVKAIPRYVGAGVDGAEIQFIVIGDLISLGVFSLLVTAALAWRRTGDWHKRLMAVASIMIIGPAVARWERIGFAVPVPLVLVGLLMAVGVYDFTRTGRLHRATLSSSLLVVFSLGALLLVAGTRTGQMIIDRLGQW